MHVLRQQQFLPLLGHLHSQWWNCGATGAVMGFIQIMEWRGVLSWFLLGDMICSKIAQRLWIMRLGISFAARNNVLGLKGLQETVQCWNMWYWIVLTCERAFRTIEHQLALKWRRYKNRTTFPDSQQFDQQNISNAYHERVLDRIPEKWPVGMVPAKWLSIGEGWWGWWPKTTWHLVVVAMGNFPNKLDVSSDQRSFLKKSCCTVTYTFAIPWFACPPFSLSQVLRFWSNNSTIYHTFQCFVQETPCKTRCLTSLNLQGRSKKKPADHDSHFGAGKVNLNGKPWGSKFWHLCGSTAERWSRDVQDGKNIPFKDLLFLSARLYYCIWYIIRACS